jgi:hypothetical protein
VGAFPTEIVGQVAGQPAHRQDQWCGQTTRDVAAPSPRDHDAGGSETGQMLGDVGLAKAEFPSELPNVEFVFAEKAHDLEARRGGQQPEQRRDLIGIPR